jgi:AcrR family transcriptional regulator
MTAAENDARPSRQRAGGRSEKVRLQVAEAVLSFLREGKADFSVAEVASRAEVHRTTVYRWWPTPTDLLQEALTVHSAHLTLPDKGAWADDVQAALERLAVFLSDPVELALTAAFASGDDPEGNALQLDHWQPVTQQLIDLLQRAIDRGEVRTDADPMAFALLAVGSISTHALAFRKAPPSRLIKELSDAITRAYSQSPPSLSHQH